MHAHLRLSSCAVRSFIDLESPRLLRRDDELFSLSLRLRLRLLHRERLDEKNNNRRDIYYRNDPCRVAIDCDVATIGDLCREPTIFKSNITMPLYELTLIVKPLIKEDLIKVATRCCNVLFDHKAIVTKIDSFGYKDLAWRMSKEKVNYFTGSHFSIGCYMTHDNMYKSYGILKSNNEVLHNYFHKILPEKEDLSYECTLDDELKPPAYRKSVEEMRRNQRLKYFTRRNIAKTAFMFSRQKPISYPIAPPKS
uniref:Small ribosomal subunit protein bS6m n=1 Tax=Romanomermis culicivorax TaxID=13658 RepID=A0A915IE37_ROMCU